MVVLKKMQKGQRVRLTAPRDDYGLQVGDLGTLVQDNDGAPFVRFDRTSNDEPIWQNDLELVPVWQPKVGDRVLVVDNMTPGGQPIVKYPVGAELVVERTSKDFEGNDVYLFLGHYQYLRQSQIAPAVAKAQPASLKLEPGKFYKTRDGKKVGPMKVNHGGMYDREYAFTTGHVRGIDGGPAWMADGKFWRDGRYSESDLVALWQEEPVANDNPAPAKPKFKVGDIVKRANNFQPRQRLRITKVNDNGSYNVEWIVGGPGSINGWRDYELELAPAEPTAIVALIEDGQPKPNSRPFIHHTVESATTEAARLAGVYKGSEFGVYVLQSTAKQEKPTYEHEWQRLAAKGEKIPAIKALRAVTGMPLKQSKDVVEHFVDSPYGAIAA